MSEYLHPLGDSVKKARKRMGLSQNQVATMIDANERTIMNIEKYRANTTMEVLYPLIRLLRIDAREIFNPEMKEQSPEIYQLRLLLDNCTEEEAATLIPVCQAVISALREQKGIQIKEKKPASPV